MEQIKIIYKYISKFIHTLKNKIFWHLFNRSNKLKQEYVDWLFEANFNNKKDFIDLNRNSISLNENCTKIISFYLPQYYENEVNNENFGKGFMEWYNVTKSIPQFTGHYQPQLPIDVGFYDLTHDDIMYRQIELAKQYGIYGFCFYYYWFSGKKLLEKPLNNFLNNKNLNIPFCLMWCNEEWTNEWSDGHNKKIIMKQELLEDDDNKFMQDIIKYFKDDRYIKIKNKPILIIYKAKKFEHNKFKNFIKNITLNAKNNGFDGIFLMTTNAYYGDIDLKELDFESVIEFSPGLLPISKETYDMKGKYVNPQFNGRIIDIHKSLSKGLHLIDMKFKTHKCVFPGWDNSARKAYCKAGATVLQMTPGDFKQWLKDAMIWTQQNHAQDEQFVFINAWNEWAEGAHLEPDQKYGYAYLQAVQDVISDISQKLLEVVK